MISTTRMSVVGRLVVGQAMLVLIVATLRVVVPLGDWFNAIAVASFCVSLGYWVAVDRWWRRYRDGNT